MSTTYNCGYGHSFPAKDANEDINPAEIQAALNTFNTALDDAISELGTSLANLKPDIMDAIRNYNKDFGYKVDDISTSLNSIKSTISGQLEGVYQAAVDKNKELQTQYDNDAKDAAAACAAKDKEALAAAAAAAGETVTTN